MEYIQGLAQQTEIFLYSLGFGFLLGILYDVFRTLRLIISRARGFVFFMDMLYFAVCAFLTFCFIMVVDSGHIRIYVALGEILGWLMYYFSFGTIAMRVSNGVVKFFRRIFKKVFGCFGRVFSAIGRKIRRVTGFGKKIIRKTDKKTKFNLQKHRSIVYNLNSYIKNNFSKKTKGIADGCNKD